MPNISARQVIQIICETISQSDTAIIIPATIFWYSFLLTFLMKRMAIKFPSIIAQPIPQPLSLPMQYN